MNLLFLYVISGASLNYGGIEGVMKLLSLKQICMMQWIYDVILQVRKCYSYKLKYKSVIFAYSFYCKVIWENNSAMKRSTDSLSLSLSLGITWLSFIFLYASCFQLFSSFIFLYASCRQLFSSFIILYASCFQFLSIALFYFYF